MNVDYRVKIGFFRHYKTRKLERELGSDGVLALIKIWEYAAEFRPDGDLSGMEDDDIELSIMWSDGRPLMPVLKKIGFVDGEAGEYRLHDWKEHNSWASEADVAIGELIRTASRSARDARDATAAQVLADSIVSEIAAGTIPAQPVSGQTDPFDPEWIYSIQVERPNQDGLLQIAVTVQRADSVNLPQRSPPFTLVRWMLDPGIDLAPPATSTDGTSSGSSSSGSSSGSGTGTGTSTGTRS